MNKRRIVFALAYPIIFIISKLPLSILYLFSNLIYYFIYYALGYRKEIVKKNLAIAFPQKSEKERLVIEKKSYRHFVDIFIEMLKGFGISREELNKRYKYVNPEVFKELESLDKSVILLGAHYGNWEWLFNINQHTNLKCYGAYKRVQNQFFDKYVKENRSRFGSHFIQTNQTIPQIAKNYRKRIPSIFGLLSDQSPQLHKTFYWAPFFGQTVPIHTGAETLAKRFDFAVMFMHVKMPKRGYYEISFEIMARSLEKSDDYSLTDAYIKKLESMIEEQPEIYFWTHDRFKHVGKAPK